MVAYWPFGRIVLRRGRQQTLGWRAGTEATGGSQAGPLQELTDGEDGDPPVGLELPEVLVAGHGVLGPTGHGACEELVVLGIAADDGEVLSHPDGFDEGEQLLADQCLDVFVPQAELGVGQDPEVLLQDGLRNQEGKPAGLPEGHQAGRRAREEQGRDHRVRIQDNAH